jgi:hypothetical protein
MATGRWDSRIDRAGPAAASAARRWRRWPLSAGIALLMAVAAPAPAQDAHSAAAPPPPGVGPMFAAPGPAPTPLTPTPPPTCTCGDRRGLSRLQWHRTHCKRALQSKWLGYPEEFNEWQLGRSLYNHGAIQVANAEAAAMIFYDFDFVDGTRQLNRRGREKLGAIAEALPTNFSTVAIEPTPQTPGLDQARRLAILAELASGPFPVPGERVVVAVPKPRGRGGAESILVERNRLVTTAAGGALAGTAGAAGTGVGPGSFDGSGLSGASIVPGVR